MPGYNKLSYWYIEERYNLSGPLLYDHICALYLSISKANRVDPDEARAACSGSALFANALRNVSMR